MFYIFLQRRFKRACKVLYFLENSILGIFGVFKIGLFFLENNIYDSITTYFRRI